jgi:hypothetical protein
VCAQRHAAVLFSANWKRLRGGNVKRAVKPGSIAERSRCRIREIEKGLESKTVSFLFLVSKGWPVQGHFWRFNGSRHIQYDDRHEHWARKVERKNRYSQCLGLTSGLALPLSAGVPSRIYSVSR